MATIQIRDIPDEVYAELRRGARASGQSLQAYMRSTVIDFAHRAALRSDVITTWEHELDENPPTVTREQVLDDLDEIRGR